MILNKNSEINIPTFKYQIDTTNIVAHTAKSNAI